MTLKLLTRIKNRLLRRHEEAPASAFDDVAQVVVTRNRLAFRRFYNTYEWRGAAHLPVRVSWQLVREMGCYTGDDYPERLDFLPWPLRLVSIEEEFIYDAGLYARTDVAFGFSWLYHRVRRTLGAMWRPTKCRVILTLMVWGLAYVPEGAVPSWRDVGEKQPW